MPATTDILPFAISVGANVMAQGPYAALASTGLGYVAGTAQSIQLNKTWRQSSFIAAGLANWCVLQGVSIPDDGNLSALVSNIQSSLAAWLAAGAANSVATLDGFAHLNPFQFPALTGDITTTAGAVATTLSNTGVTAGTYTKVAVNTKGRVTAGASLASADVTGALGYTPYNSTNPNGYISGITSSNVTTALGYVPAQSLRVQNTAPQANSASFAVGAGTGGNTSAALTVPSGATGFIDASGFVNLATAAAVGSSILCELRVNGSLISTDSTQQSQAHRAFFPASPGTTYTATIQILGSGVSPATTATLHVAIAFIPLGT